MNAERSKTAPNINAQRSKSRAGVLSLEWEGGLAEHLALCTRALVATALMGWL